VTAGGIVGTLTDWVQGQDGREGPRNDILEAAYMPRLCEDKIQRIGGGETYNASATVLSKVYPRCGLEHSAGVS
jgi:hypothetical protein